MFATLEMPNYKGISLLLRNLADDRDQFDQFDMTAGDWDSERARGRRALNKINHLLGENRSPAFSMMFYQYNCRGTLGVEYWSKDYARVLMHALAVTRSLQIPLHVDVTVGGILEQVAKDNGWTFELDEGISPDAGDDAESIDARIAKADIWLLRVVSIDAQLPTLCADCLCDETSAPGEFCKLCAREQR